MNRGARDIGAVFGCLLLLAAFSNNLRAQTISEAAQTPEGTGPFKAIMESDPTLPTHTVYRPNNRTPCAA